MKAERDIFLYHLIFPMSIIYFAGILFPFLWIFLLPANFLIDSLMLFVLFGLMKLPEKKELYKKLIWRTWALGFLADFIASGALFAADSLFPQEINIYVNPLSNPYTFLLTTAGILLAGLLIYIFQRSFVLKRAELTEGEKKKIALGMAVLTAPYLMYLPSL